MAKTMLKSDAAMMLLAEEDAHERTAAAARAMLAALQDLAGLSAYADKRPDTDTALINKHIHKAKALIAQAEAAGIKAEG